MCTHISSRFTHPKKSNTDNLRAARIYNLAAVTDVHRLQRRLMFSPLKARDAGGSMVIHTFGGYYGLSISWMLYRPNLDQSSRLQGSVYHSDVFAMIGGWRGVFLMLKPSTTLCCRGNALDVEDVRWLSAQAPSSCGCSGPASTQPSQTTETGSIERPSTPTWPWPPRCSPLWPSPASSRSTAN